MGIRVVSVRRDQDWLIQVWKKVIDGELLAMRNLFSFPFLFPSFSLLDTTQGTIKRMPSCGGRIVVACLQGSC